MTGIETVTFEAEGATVGSNWEISADDQASNGSYAAVKPGTQSIQAAPTGTASAIAIAFLCEGGRQLLRCSRG